MSECLITSGEKYYEEAKKMLEKKDLVGFIENISIAKLLAEKNKDLYAQVTYLKAKGLYFFRKFDKVLEAIDEALKYNEGTEQIRLQKLKGLIYGYRGLYKKAIKIFKDTLNQTDNPHLLIELYINIAWANLSFYRINEKEELLEEAKKYLDLAREYFDDLENNYKKKLILLNYSDYYSLKKDYDKAIEMLEEAKKYCEEKDLPLIYNSLAELHIEHEEFNLVEQYLHKAEVIANKHNNLFEVARALYIKGIVETLEEDWVRAKDSFYVALDNFNRVHAYRNAFECFIKIIELSQYFKLDCITSFKENIKSHLEETSFYNYM
ncbi:hypothetical protein BBF96_01415 [Anoxybacter fermentans]|uniref:MalT-like TPR region domain-containing protein n=1 Tax=Anoxybacter fermentans TaxID=1323375 RepID=A0A3Q9HNX5_9FIRM|nr:hypothetical protein [Anoxybacter fermentans]AZR72169.1 hypothetical protein BBF96_01415 [Anoxybacter fermentans]